MGDVVVLTGTGLVCPEAAGVPQLLAAGPARGDEQGWFDPVPYLGARGWKYLSPATRYLLAAATLAVADAQLRPAELPDESMGVMVGTNLAANPVVSRLDRTVIAEGADLLSPAEAPNFSVNIPASHISMRYGMRAFNVSLTNPVVAGAESVIRLASAIRRGRAQAGIAGATEERPEDGWASEGACCFVVERDEHAVTRGAGADRRAALAGGFCRFVPPSATATGWERAVGRPLRDLLTGPRRPADPLPYAGPAGCGEFGRQVDQYCRGVAERCGVTLQGRRYLGDDGRYLTASPLLQVAGLVAELGRGLVVAASPHGHVAALRLDSVDDASVVDDANIDEANSGEAEVRR